jgi:hypothetical protein
MQTHTHRQNNRERLSFSTKGKSELEREREVKVEPFLIFVFPSLWIPVSHVALTKLCPCGCKAKASHGMESPHCYVFINHHLTHSYSLIITNIMTFMMHMNDCVIRITKVHDNNGA